MEVRIEKEGVRLNGKPLKKGDTKDVPAYLANRWIEIGFATDPSDKPKKSGKKERAETAVAESGKTPEGDSGAEKE